MNSTLAILTFNVGLLNLSFLGMTVIEPAPYIEERLHALPVALLAMDVDIIALQEIYEEGHRQYLISELQAVYPHVVYYRKGRYWGIDSSLMFFSKFPIIVSDLQVFKHAPLEEKIFDSKGILSITIETESFGKISLHNAHTTAGGLFNDPEEKKIDKIRDKQIRQLLDVSDHASGDLSFILGDINAGPGVSESNYQLLLNNGFVDVFQQVCQKDHDCGQVTWDPKNPLNANGVHNTSPPQRVDHILIPEAVLNLMEIVEAKIIFNEPIVELNDGSNITLSDHYGILVQLVKN